jgi:ubiquinone/menaquinone biosynthesis C-methylase UbiE
MIKKGKHTNVKVKGFKMSKSKEEALKMSSGIKVAGETGQRTLDEAKVYEKNRFGKSSRGIRLNKIDKKFAQSLLDIVGEDSCILDIPCGTGRFYPVFSKANKLIMIDRDPNMLKSLEEMYRPGDNVQFFEGDITSISLDDNSVDLCISMRMFHHIDSEELVLKVIKELSRVSCKYVAFSFYNKNCWRYFSRAIRGKKTTGYYYSFGLINKYAKIAGLGLVKKKPVFNLLEQQCLVLFEKFSVGI